MNVDLSVYSFIIVGLKGEAPVLKDYAALEINADVPQHIKVYPKINGDIVTVQTHVYISANLVHGTDKHKGAYYVFQNETLFKLADFQEITPVMVAELSLHHLGIVSFQVIQRTAELHSKGQAFDITTPPISKLLLWIEELWHSI